MYSLLFPPKMIIFVFERFSLSFQSVENDVGCLNSVEDRWKTVTVVSDHQQITDGVNSYCLELEHHYFCQTNKSLSHWYICWKGLGWKHTLAWHQPWRIQAWWYQHLSWWCRKHPNTYSLLDEEFARWYPVVSSWKLNLHARWNQRHTDSESPHGGKAWRTPSYSDLSKIGGIIPHSIMKDFTALHVTAHFPSAAIQTPVNDIFITH